MNLVQAQGKGAPTLEDCPSSSPAPGSLHVKGEAKDPEQPGVVMLAKPLSEV